VNLDEEKRGDRRDEQDEGKQKASDEELGGALLLGARAGNAEGGNEVSVSQARSFMRRAYSE